MIIKRAMSDDMIMAAITPADNPVSSELAPRSEITKTILLYMVMFAIWICLHFSCEFRVNTNFSDGKTI